MKYYAGIGSRETPTGTRGFIHEFVDEFNRQGYTLRSGGADGADTFFEEKASLKDIYLPWKGFNGRPQTRERSLGASYIQGPTKAAIDLAARTIHGFERRSQGAQKLLARNMHQVLGEDLSTPVEMVICWTPEGKIVGGTAHAIRLAKKHEIPIFNLAKEKDILSLRDRLYQRRIFDL